jgi:hypothetical protein
MFQWRKPIHPRDDETSIGNLAVSRGLVTFEQLEDSLKHQEESLPLGQVMIDHMLISSDQLKDLLLEQKIRRNKHKSKTAGLYARRTRERIKDVSMLLKEAAAVMRAFASRSR